MLFVSLVPFCFREMATSVKDQQFCLRWDSFHSNMTSSFHSLRSEEEFVDVTLVAEGELIKAHRLVLSACSPFFKKILKVGRHWVASRHVMNHQGARKSLYRSSTLNTLASVGVLCQHSKRKMNLLATNLQSFRKSAHSNQHEGEQEIQKWHRGHYLHKLARMASKLTARSLNWSD